ncbi:MAG: hypothetical protein MUO34_03595 [Ignavibacteriaceae bacterium]|nr:hypothetical protein [Ignavibacteriaceae bacterium]
MKIFAYSTIIILFLSCLSLAQEIQKDSLSVKNKSIDAIQNIQYRFEEFDLYRETYHSNFLIPLDEDKSTLQLRTEMIISQSLRNNFNLEGNDFYFLSPLYEKYLEESKFNPVRYVLGMAQLGAVGYLAYRHIKKYGFID